jgi:hypothetical protein
MSYTQDLRNIIAQIRRVATGDRILPEDHNLQTDGLEKSADYIDDIYDRIINLIQKGGIFSADLIPNVDLSLNIGSSDLKWNELHAKKGYFDELYLAGSPIVPGKYKYIASNRIYNYYNIINLTHTHDSILNGSYKIGEDTFPFINQVLQPYDLLLIFTKFKIRFWLDIPTTVSDFVVYHLNEEAKIYGGSENYPYSWIYNNECSYFYINTLVHEEWKDIEHTGLLFTVIPSDYPILTFKGSIYLEITRMPEGVGYTESYTEIDHYIVLYRPT